MEREPRAVDPATPNVPVLEELTKLVSPVTLSSPPTVVLLAIDRPNAPIVEKTERPPCICTEL